MTKRYRASKNVTKTISEVQKLEKQIEDIKNGKVTSRSAVINEKNLKNLEKKLKSFKEGRLNSNFQVNPHDYTSQKTVDGAGIEPNILHKFATYNTLFTLSGLREEELQDHSFLTNPVHDVVARSGGIGGREGANVSASPFSGTRFQGVYKDKIIRSEEKQYDDFYKDSADILEKGRDIFFEEVNMISTVGPSEERGLADFVKMEFKLHEPFGISFVEKMRAAARLQGYKDHLDAPMLLTIEFKGFNELGIPMDGQGTVRKIPVLITRVDLDVNEGGAIYDVTAVRINDIAFDDRFKFPRTVINFTANGLQDAGEKLVSKLKKQIEVEKKELKVREVEDEYKIEFHEDVLKLAGDVYVGEKSVSHARAPGVGTNPVITLDTGETAVTNNTSIVRLIEDMVRQTKYYEDIATDLWATYLTRAGAIERKKDISNLELKKLFESDKFEQIVEKNPFVDWFKIKTSVQTHYKEPLDRINKMHRKTVTYKVIPYKIHVLKFLRPGVFMKAGAAKSQVKKQYNYIYTGANVDIQNLRINYKTAYYMRNAIEISKGSDTVFDKIDDLITRIVGNEDPTKGDVTMTRAYPSSVKGRTVFNKSSSNNAKEARKQEFYDYLTNPVADMMRIEMTILGDPAYLCQDQFIPLDKDGGQNISGSRYDQASGSFNADSYTPLIELIYRLPDDIDDKKGLTFDSKKMVAEENLFFAGVYQVVKIDHSMSNGQFLQTLTCVRLNNQQGAGLPAAIETGVADIFAAKKKTLENLVDEPNFLKKNADGTFIYGGSAIKDREKYFKDLLER